MQAIEQYFAVVLFKAFMVYKSVDEIQKSDIQMKANERHLSLLLFAIQHKILFVIFLQFELNMLLD